MSKPEEGKVRRVPQAETGDTPDGVELYAKCNVTNFKVKGKEVVGLGSQALSNCKMMASFQNGVVSISVRGARPFMVSVRLDEMMALLKEAADYNREVVPREDGENKSEE